MTPFMHEGFVDTSDLDPGIEGPDYVALVIEWDDDDEVTNVERALPRRPLIGGKIATVVGALVALALAAWAVRRLRTAA